ncbi:hypothetical protein EVAR_102555_1 [Eumeta japonica]|uniref:Uncharacterized protein n=1 Tax=Eumeta variegata TaxID=151549 RepID=A0A4C2A892_EUMVA|nr:hypothetical protein EVAR_102555_1 [Eumeta japonica]
MERIRSIFRWPERIRSKSTRTEPRAKVSNNITLVTYNFYNGIKKPAKRVGSCRICCLLTSVQIVSCNGRRAPAPCSRNEGDRISGLRPQSLRRANKINYEFRVLTTGSAACAGFRTRLSLVVVLALAMS